MRNRADLSFFPNSAWVSEMSAMSTFTLLQADREHFTQLLFEQFNVAGLYLGEQGVLSLYSVGKTTGTVIDLGHGKTGDDRFSHCGWHLFQISWVQVLLLRAAAAVLHVGYVSSRAASAMLICSCPVPPPPMPFHLQPGSVVRGGCTAA